MSLSTQIRAQLQTLDLPTPSDPWLQALTTARPQPPPLPSLVMTAKTRLLASDLTTPGLLPPSSPSFPPGLADPTTQETRLPRAVHAQVVGVEDLSRSRWEQAEELEAVARGELTRGREVVRLVPADEGDGDGDGTATTATTAATAAANPERKGAVFRLVLQDCRGQRVFALEVARVPRAGGGAGPPCMGEKVLLRRGAVVARGTVLLEPGCCRFLGGRVEQWQRAWVEGRLARLKEAVGAGQAGGDS